MTHLLTIKAKTTNSHLLPYQKKSMNYTLGAYFPWLSWYPPLHPFFLSKQNNLFIGSSQWTITRGLSFSNVKSNGVWIFLSGRGSISIRVGIDMV